MFYYIKKCPGASEAFKGKKCQLFTKKAFIIFLHFLAIGNAFAVLSDTEKRKQYDLYGPLEDQQSSLRRHSHRSGRHEFSRGFEGGLVHLSTDEFLCEYFLLFS